jgi:hypothetical protein
VCVAPSQTGVPPAQSADATQPTQVPVDVWHTGVAPTHWVLFVAEHSAHAPEAWHAGETPPHSPSPVQARHACVVGSQIGLPPPHCPEPRQPTQVPDTTLHTGVAPAQDVAFVAEHAPHAPFGWQAGDEPPQSVSAAQPRHVCVARLQVGVVPPHVAFVVHATQVAVVVSHAGVAPEQSAAFVAEHAPQAPLD